MDDTKTTQAEQFAAKVPTFSPRVWARGNRVRVYLKYPRGYEGGAGGGDLGYVEITDDGPTFRGRAPADLLDNLREAGAK